MADGTIPSFPRFEPHVDTGDVAVRWRKCVGKFRNIMVAMNIDNDARQKALLLHYVGDEPTDIFDTLLVAEPTEHLPATTTWRFRPSRIISLLNKTWSLIYTNFVS